MSIETELKPWRRFPFWNPGAQDGNRRRHLRFEAPDLLVIGVFSQGILGWLRGDLVLRPLDVSEGGLRALLKRQMSVGKRVWIRLGDRESAALLEVEAEVSLAASAREVAGGYVTSLSLVKPSPVFRAALQYSQDRQARTLRSGVQALRSMFRSVDLRDGEGMSIPKVMNRVLAGPERAWKA